MTKPYLQSVRDGADVSEQQSMLPNDALTAPAGPPIGGPPRGDGDAPAGGRATPRQRAERSLPTDRLSFEKQVEALRAIAQISGSGRRPVTAEEISSTLGLRGNTGGLSNKFFRDTGWIEPHSRGTYVPTEELLSFHQQLAVDPTAEAAAKEYLLHAARSSWYWQEIADMVQGAGVRETAVMFKLVKAAGASPDDHKSQLALIIEWLIWLGLVHRDGDIVLAGPAAALPAATADPEPDGIPDEDEPSAVEVESALPTPAQEASAETQADPTPAAPAALRQTADEAMVSVTVSVRITAEDAANMSDERLASLLAFAERMRS
ncbi:hypothetical protein [Geodermatophilus sp. SYSU D00815]